MIATEHPVRHPLQALVSTGQIYGDILYYATSLFDHHFKGLTYYRPEVYFFWAYYFFMNFIWIVIPGSKFRLFPVACAIERLIWKPSTFGKQYPGNCESVSSAR